MVNQSPERKDTWKKIAHTQEHISTTWHESGHVICAFLNFMKVTSVKVYLDKDTQYIDGMTYYDHPFILETIQDAELQRKMIQAYIGICYAGLIAEKYQFKLHSGSDKFPSVLNGSSGDLKDASATIKQFQLAPPGPKRYAYKKKTIRRVAKQLQNHWGDVTLVAHALYSRKRLSFADLKELLIKKSERKDFWKQHLAVIEKFYDQPSYDEQEFKQILAQTNVP